MRRVLIIDDSLTVRMDLDQLFREEGWLTALCATAEAARLALAKGPFDVIVLDILLPDAHGIELLQEFKKDPSTGGIPVILLSSQAEVADQLGDASSGADDYVGKPYDRTDLVLRAWRLVESKGSTAQSRGGTSHVDSLRGPKRILAVDDSPTYLHMLAEYLQVDGYDVVLAHSGQEALDVLQVQRVDCILLDFVMPGMTGQETCRKIKESSAWRSIPVVMLTGREDQEAMIEGFSAGADDYVPKSSDFAVLRARLRAQLRRRQFEEENDRIREQLHHKEIEVAEVRAARELAETRAALLADLQRKNAELEESHRAMQALNETLEQRVTDRTAEVQQRAAQLRALAAQLTQAEQKERQRLAEILHDHLQQLLVGTKFHLGMVRAQYKDADLRLSLDQIDSLLDQSLETSRSLTVDLSPPILHQGNMAQVLRWLADWVRSKHGLKVKVKVQSDEQADPQAHEVRVLLFQAVRELLFNVVKHAMVDEVVVELSRLDEHRIQVVVCDGGVGFDPCRLQTDSHKGSGFGLFNIRERFEWLGGSLEIESSPGYGTRATLMAPVRLAATSAGDMQRDDQAERTRLETAIAGGATGSNGTQKIRVLLADDHAVVRDGLAGLLQKQPDMEVVGQAADGRQAVDMAIQLHPHVVLMDVSMPVMDGKEATRLILAALPQSKVIALSMFSEPDVDAAMKAAGATAYMTKTTSPQHLVEKIRACRR